MKTKLITLGCPKNIVDSEHLSGALIGHGMTFTDEIHEAEAIIINTCGFIESAKEESIETILDALEFKKTGTCQKVIVTGCLSERYGPELRKEMPEIDGIYGNRDLAQIAKDIALQFRLKKELLGERNLLTPKHFAYLKISEGCEHPCTFCAIPKIRGGFRSTPVENLVREAELLAQKGVRELVLIAQDSTQYGMDLNGQKQLPSLLRKLNEVEGIEWIRLMYAYPHNMTDELIDTIAGLGHVCNYLDMPMQHTSTPMLKRMARRVTAEFQSELLDKLRNQIPDLTFRTSVIVGFPGETDADFQKLYDDVSAGLFDRLGVFTYSHEDNTPAERFEDSVLDHIKRERQDLLYQAQAEVSEAKNKKQLGEELRVLIDEFDYNENKYRGRLSADAPEIDNSVVIAQHCSIGSFYHVRITETNAFELTGEILHKENSTHHTFTGPIRLPVTLKK